MGQRSTERTLAKLYMFFAKKGLLPLPAELPRRRRRRPPEGDLRTPQQAARFLKVSVKTLANWRVKGKGPTFRKIGSRVVYDVADVKAFAAESARTSTSDKGGRND